MLQSCASTPFFRLTLVLFLAGCGGFSSEQPLVDASRAIMPFEKTLVMEVIPKNRDDEAFEITLRPKADAYEVAVNGQDDGGFRARLFDLAISNGDNDVLGLQVWEPGKGAEYAYLVAPRLIQPNTRVSGVFYAPANAQAETLDDAGVSFGEFRGGGFKLETYRDLYGALRAAALNKELEITAGYHARPVRGGGATTTDFSEQGYANPKLLAAIYRGKKGDRDLSVYGLYLLTFVEMFTNTTDIRGCRDVISIPAHGKLTAMGISDGFGKVLGPLLDAHKRGSDGRDDALNDGAQAGLDAVIEGGGAEVRGRHDAQVFFQRHGCDSRTARRFFANMERIVLE